MKNIYEIRNDWFLDQVKGLEKDGITQVEIAQRLNVKPQYINNILHGRQNASERFVKRFCNAFNINQNTLLKLYTDDDELDEAKKGIRNYERKGIPLIGLDVAAGFGTSDFVITDQDIQELYVVPDFSNIDFMIRVKGNSMYPKYSSGDIIACRKIRESRFIQWNKCHVVATMEQGLLVKRLKKSQKENHVVAVSDNQEYDPFEIPKNEITGIALVVGVIRLE